MLQAPSLQVFGQSYPIPRQKGVTDSDMGGKDGTQTGRSNECWEWHWFTLNGRTKLEESIFNSHDIFVIMFHYKLPAWLVVRFLRGSGWNPMDGCDIMWDCTVAKYSTNSVHRWVHIAPWLFQHISIEHSGVNRILWILLYLGNCFHVGCKRF